MSQPQSSNSKEATVEKQLTKIRQTLMALNEDKPMEGTALQPIDLTQDEDPAEEKVDMDEVILMTSESEEEEMIQYLRPPSMSQRRPWREERYTGKAVSALKAGQRSTDSSGDGAGPSSRVPTGSHASPGPQPATTVRKKRLGLRGPGTTVTSSGRNVQQRTTSKRGRPQTGNAVFCQLCEGRVTGARLFGYGRRMAAWERARWPGISSDSSSEEEASSSEEESEISISE